MNVPVIPCAGIDGPLLIVADAAAVGRCAPAWSRALEAAGIDYRVRLLSIGAGRVAAIVAEARSLGARTIAAAGGDDALAAGRAAAIAACLAFVQFPTGGCGADG